MRERIALLSRSKAEAMFWVDAQGRLVWMNDLAASFLGPSHETSLGGPSWEAFRGCRWSFDPAKKAVMSGEEVSAFQLRMDALFSRMLLEEEGATVAISETVCVHGGGVLCWKEGMVLGGQRRGERGVLWVLCDAKSAEIAAHQAEEARKMMGGRLLLGALLHDLNNNLNCVIGAMDLVEEMEDGASLFEMSRQLVHNAVSSALGVSSRASSLLRKLTDASATIFWRDLLEDLRAYLRWRGGLHSTLVFDVPDDESLEIWGLVELLRDLWRMIGESILLIGDGGSVEIHVSAMSNHEIRPFELGGFLLMPGTHDEITCRFSLRQSFDTPLAKLLAPTVGEEENALRVMISACSIILRKHQGAMQFSLSSTEEKQKVSWHVFLPRRTSLG
ncbi:hypothetical protein L6R29_24415 [Myxococcota bacterium]|nr:hypothetical protein [Myxococcota bacterium]